ncbi:hypothetical protein CHS0354_038892 [Potamilus streckersoni]|uniref:Transmembrane protein n=1 Tax=Potamilus streckersoni TaxID=2493646 RepID=A0AAE0T2F6_9BIVA|nr:hypothetical protein CHS0354_038892 [Potamilus streckersoni]
MTVHVLDGSYTVRKHKADSTDMVKGDDEDEPSGLCCIGGCLSGVAIGFVYLVIFPAGILLMVYATRSKDNAVLGVAVLLILITLASIPIFVVVFYNRQRIRKFRKRKISSLPHVDESVYSVTRHHEKF